MRTSSIRHLSLRKSPSTKKSSKHLPTSTCLMWRKTLTIWVLHCSLGLRSSKCMLPCKRQIRIVCREETFHPHPPASTSNGQWQTLYSAVNSRRISQKRTDSPIIDSHIVTSRLDSSTRDLRPTKEPEAVTLPSQTEFNWERSLRVSVKSNFSRIICSVARYKLVPSRNR